MKPSTSPLISSPEDTALEAHLKAYLHQVCANAAVHARFLNTVSFLEHMGSRKIMLSQATHALSLSMLQHLAEETRHAFFFRKAAEKLAGHALTYGTDNVLAPPAARMYLGRLDAAISREVRGHSPHLPYLYVSAVVEVRAMWFFRLYDAVLREENQGISLRGVIAEEEGHLEDMTAKLQALDERYPERFPQFLTYEKGLFEKLLPRLLVG